MLNYNNQDISVIVVDQFHYYQYAFLWLSVCHSTGNQINMSKNTVNCSNVFSQNRNK